MRASEHNPIVAWYNYLKERGKVTSIRKFAKIVVINASSLSRMIDNPKHLPREDTVQRVAQNLAKAFPKLNIDVKTFHNGPPQNDSVLAHGTGELTPSEPDLRVETQQVAGEESDKAMLMKLITRNLEPLNYRELIAIYNVVLIIAEKASSFNRE